LPKRSQRGVDRLKQKRIIRPSGIPKRQCRCHTTALVGFALTPDEDEALRHLIELSSTLALSFVLPLRQIQSRGILWLYISSTSKGDIFSPHRGFKPFRQSRVMNSTAVGQSGPGCAFQPIIFGKCAKNDITVGLIRSLEKTNGQFGNFGSPMTLGGHCQVSLKLGPSRL
jgi:hypothetical protein